MTNFMVVLARMNSMATQVMVDYTSIHVLMSRLKLAVRLKKD
jgi:hypothetical protein